MKLFFSAAISGPKELLQHQELVAELKKLGITVITNLDVKKGDFDGTGFAELDAVIIEASVPDPDTGYTLAIALAHKKQVLYLLRKGTLIDSSVSALAKNKDVKTHLHIAFYSEDALERKVKSFLQYLDQNIGHESMSIKFTLRMSPRIDRYLSWKAKNVQKNKADYLREWLDEQLKSDAEYSKRLG